MPSLTFAITEQSEAKIAQCLEERQDFDYRCSDSCLNFEYDSAPVDILMLFRFPKPIQEINPEATAEYVAFLPGGVTEEFYASL